MGLFRRALTGRKTLHQMKSLDLVFLVPHLFNPAHIGKSGFQGAADGRLKQILFGFVPVEGVTHCFPQRACAAAFFLVQNITDTVVQAVHGDDTGVGDCSPSFFQPVVDRLPILLYQFPDLPGNAEHLVYALLANLTSGIGIFRQLVGVVAEPRDFSQQIRVVGTGLGPQFRTQDQGPQKFLPAKSAFFHLNFQMPQLSGV